MGTGSAEMDGKCTEEEKRKKRGGKLDTNHGEQCLGHDTEASRQRNNPQDGARTSETKETERSTCIKAICVIISLRWTQQVVGYRQRCSVHNHLNCRSVEFPNIFLQDWITNGNNQMCQLSFIKKGLQQVRPLLVNKSWHYVWMATMATCMMVRGIIFL